MESELHKELKLKAKWYLWNKGFRLVTLEKTAGYYGIFDVWGMNYSSYYTIGIEVKVSRSDFFAAHKWKERRLNEQNLSRQGLDWGGANDNYYLCPAGLIKPNEVGVYGLLWWNGKRLISKKKPKFIKIHLKSKLDQLIGFLQTKPLI